VDTAASAGVGALAPRPLGDYVITGREGPARVIVRVPSFAAYIDLACSLIRRYGAAEATVTAALLVMLQDALALVSDPSREQALAGQARLILSDAERSTPSPQTSSRCGIRPPRCSPRYQQQNVPLNTARCGVGSVAIACATGRQLGEVVEGGVPDDFDDELGREFGGGVV